MTIRGHLTIWRYTEERPMACEPSIVALWHWQPTCLSILMNNYGSRTYHVPAASEKGIGPGSAGQSGDTQGLSDIAEAGDESVEELVEEGQYAEADAIEGVEDAPDADVSEVHTKQVPEDDVPSEYLGAD